MTALLNWIRLAAAAFALAVVLGLAAPAGAQQPSSVNPTASAVKEQQLLQELQRIQGRGTIPDVKSYVLEQPMGREWRQFHEVTLRWIGAIAILGMVVLLVGFYMWRGMVRIEAGRSGRTIVRFSAYERFVHWLTATTFIILGITGLNITFGRPLLLPLMSPEAFTTWSQAAKYAHNFLSFAFTLGVVLMFVMWIANNLPTRVDLEWLKEGGGLFGDREPPAYRFNAGQKMLYWFVVVGGAAMMITGYMLIFPFYGTNIANMQLAEIFHGIVGMLFIALILAHIYLGTIGMEGAFEAMGTGEVDLNWAKQHHSLWVEEEFGRGRASAPPVRARATPAE
jgi:formate dehydrogenase subunit gamma